MKLILVSPATETTNKKPIQTGPQNSATKFFFHRIVQQKILSITLSRKEGEKAAECLLIPLLFFSPATRFLWWDKWHIADLTKQTGFITKSMVLHDTNLAIKLSFCPFPSISVLPNFYSCVYLFDIANTQNNNTEPAPSIISTYKFSSGHGTYLFKKKIKKINS